MFSAFVKVQLVGADIPGILGYLCEHGIELRDVTMENMLCVCFVLSYEHYKQMRKLVKNKGVEVKVLLLSGLVFTLKSVFRRPILLLGISLLVFLSLWLPGKVLFICVEGNQKISTTQILQQAEQCGIYFGAKRSDIRSEVVKNHLLEALPNLGWAGVNTAGCTAVISVREDTREERRQEDIRYSSVVAVRDGIVLSYTATSGQALCSVGQAVTKGQTLISGYQDLGILVKLSRAQGEVFAQTNRRLEVLTPQLCKRSGEILEQQTLFSLIIGKNRINLSKGSGISYTGCDKIYKEYYLTLPGGFVLPVAIAVEQVVVYEQSSFLVDEDDLQRLLQECSDQYLLDQTVSGSILDQEYYYASDAEAYSLSADYTCIEMIGRERKEEINIQYGKDN